MALAAPARAISAARASEVVARAHGSWPLDATSKQPDGAGGNEHVDDDPAPRVDVEHVRLLYAKADRRMQERSGCIGREVVHGLTSAGNLAGRLEFA